MGPRRYHDQLVQLRALERRAQRDLGEQLAAVVASRRQSILNQQLPVAQEARQIAQMENHFKQFVGRDIGAKSEYWLPLGPN